MLGDPPSEHRVEKWNSKRSGREGDNQKKPREAIEVSWKNLQIWCFDVGILAVSDTQKCGKLSERLPIVVKLRVSWASEPTVGEAFKLQTSKNSVLYVTSQGCYVVGGWVGGAISERSTGSFALKRLAEVA